MKNVHLLLVDDNEGDILLTTEAFDERDIINKISVVKNGRDAIDYLFQRGEYKNAEKPDLILLDINMPFKNGHEVLKEIKENESTRHIPVIMLTTSSSAKDINLSYKLHANCYITKPLEMDDFINAASSIEDFWVNLAALPKQHRTG